LHGLRAWSGVLLPKRGNCGFIASTILTRCLRSQNKPETLFQQRRRWTNGSVAGYVWLIAQWDLILRKRYVVLIFVLLWLTN
jgi:hypothetical protein